MKINIALAASAMILILVGFAIAADQKSASTPAADEGLKIHGTVVSSSSTQLVVTSNINGKKEQVTFVVNPKTKVTVKLKAGEKVSVHYKIEKSQKVATAIKPRKEEEPKSK
jgi:hypothetical protein